MTKDLLVVSETATIVEDLDTTPMSVWPPTKEEKTLLGNVVISNFFLRTRKIMVVHSNKRG